MFETSSCCTDTDSRFRWENTSKRKKPQTRTAYDLGPPLDHWNSHQRGQMLSASFFSGGKREVWGLNIHERGTGVVCCSARRQSNHHGELHHHAPSQTGSLAKAPEGSLFLDCVCVRVCLHASRSVRGNEGLAFHRRCQRLINTHANNFVSFPPQSEAAGISCTHSEDGEPCLSSRTLIGLQATSDVCLLLPCQGDSGVFGLCCAEACCLEEVGLPTKAASPSRASRGQWVIGLPPVTLSGLPDPPRCGSGDGSSLSQSPCDDEVCWRCCRKKASPASIPSLWGLPSPALSLRHILFHSCKEGPATQWDAPLIHSRGRVMVGGAVAVDVALADPEMEDPAVDVPARLELELELEFPRGWTPDSSLNSCAEEAALASVEWRGQWEFPFCREAREASSAEAICWLGLEETRFPGEKSVMAGGAPAAFLEGLCGCCETQEACSRRACKRLTTPPWGAAEVSVRRGDGDF